MNCVQLDDEHYAAYVLDVVGHGVPAALLSVTLCRMLSPSRDRSSLLYSKTPQGPVIPKSPAEICRELNERFPIEQFTGQFFTIVAAVLNVASGEIRIASAGHPSPILVARDGAPQILPMSSRGAPIGVLPDGAYGEERLMLSPGDRLFLYSDGLPDTFSAEDKPFGDDGIIAALSQRAASPADALNILEGAVAAWREGRASDDLSVLALEFRGAAPA